MADSKNINLLNPEENLRIDRNFAYKITVFKEYGKQDEQLIKDIIVYMSSRFQKDLFGFIDLGIIITSVFMFKLNVSNIYFFVGYVSLLWIIISFKNNFMIYNFNIGIICFGVRFIF